jgi:hypothetical protein
VKRSRVRSSAVETPSGEDLMLSKLVDSGQNLEELAQEPLGTWFL